MVFVGLVKWCVDNWCIGKFICFYSICWNGLSVFCFVDLFGLFGNDYDLECLCWFGGLWFGFELGNCIWSLFVWSWKWIWI